MEINSHCGGIFDEDITRGVIQLLNTGYQEGVRSNKLTLLFAYVEEKEKLTGEHFFAKYVIQNMDTELNQVPDEYIWKKEIIKEYKEYYLTEVCLSWFASEMREVLITFKNDKIIEEVILSKVLSTLRDFEKKLDEQVKDKKGIRAMIVMFHIIFLTDLYYSKNFTASLQLEYRNNSTFNNILREYYEALDNSSDEEFYEGYVKEFLLQEMGVYTEGEIYTAYMGYHEKRKDSNSFIAF